VLVVEGLDPERGDQARGLLVRFGNNPETGQPMTTSEWLDKLAPRAWAIVAAGTCACYGGIHAMAGNPTGAMGVADYLGWDYPRRRAAPRS
jgi:hydrogenase small subunit